LTNAKRDQNYVTTLLGVQLDDLTTPSPLVVDQATGRLLVNAVVSIDTTGLASDTNQTNGSQKTQLVDAGGEAVTITGGKLDVNASVDTTGLATSAKQLPDGHNVVVTSMPAVTVDTTGLATDTLQTAGNGSLTTIAGKDFATQTTLALIKAKTDNLDVALSAGTAKLQIVDALGDAVTMTGGKMDVNASIDTTGLATSAKQDTLDTSVNTLLKPASTLSAVTTVGTITNVVHIDDNAGSLTIDNSAITSIDGKIPALGQALAAGSVPIVLTAAQMTTLTPPSAITGFATETTLGTVHGHVDSIDTKTPALGQALASASVPVVLTSAQMTTLTPPAQGLTDAQLRATAVPISVATIPSHAVTNAGTFAVQSTNQANSGVDIGDVTINNSTGANAVNIQDGGNTITVDGTVAVTNADLTTLAGAVSATHMQADVLTLPANASVNNAQINGITPLMGAGNTGTGSQRVTIATDQAAVASKAAIDTYVDGSIVTIGAKADAKSTATDTTAVTMMQVMKQISASVQAPPSQAVTNAGTFAVQTTSSITGIGHGVKTVTTAGTDVALAASTACKKVLIQSQTDNTSLIAIGGSGVDATVATGTGIVLYPGDVFELEIDNLADVYVDSLVNGEGVRFTYFT
jgi:hypothetical protein